MYLCEYETISCIPYPISRKICLISARTFIRGWKWPRVGGTPSASKLYALKLLVSQAPLEWNMHMCTSCSNAYTYMYMYMFIHNVQYTCIELKPVCVVVYTSQSYNMLPGLTWWQVYMAFSLQCFLTPTQQGHSHRPGCYNMRAHSSCLTEHHLTRSQRHPGIIYRQQLHVL